MKLVESYHFQINDKIHLDYVLALTNKYGFKWWSGCEYPLSSDKVPFGPYGFVSLPFMLVVRNDGLLDWNKDGSTYYKEIPIQNWEKYLKDIHDKNKEEIYIGDIPVLFNSDGSIGVGCTKVSFDIIDRIYNKSYDIYRSINSVSEEKDDIPF